MIAAHPYLQALVGGIVESIRLAHEDLQPGRLLLNSGELLDANINRSPTAYLLNPPEERARYRSCRWLQGAHCKTVYTTESINIYAMPQGLEDTLFFKKMQTAVKHMSRSAIACGLFTNPIILWWFKC